MNSAASWVQNMLDIELHPFFESPFHISREFQVSLECERSMQSTGPTGY